MTDHNFNRIMLGMFTVGCGCMVFGIIKSVESSETTAAEISALTARIAKLEAESIAHQRSISAVAWPEPITITANGWVPMPVRGLQTFSFDAR